MIHLLWQIFIPVSAVVGLFAAYALLLRLSRAFVSFVGDVVDVAVALFFFLVIVPPLWLWEKGRRRMWRTLTARELEVLIRGVKR